MTIPNCESWETGKPFTGIPSKFVIANEDGENIGTLADLLPMLLYAANNLQDLENPETARENLGVYSTNEVDDAIADATPDASESIAGKAKIATTAITQAGENNTDIVTPSKLKAVNFGYGGGYSDVTSALIAGTTYTNTTGRLIAFNFILGSSASATVVVTVDGDQVGSGSVSTDWRQGKTITVFVQPGKAYSYTGTPSAIKRFL